MVTITPQGFKVGDKICWHNQPDSSVYTIEKITSHGYLWLSCGGKAIPFVEHPARFQFAPLDGETEITNADDPQLTPMEAAVDLYLEFLQLRFSLSEEEKSELDDIEKIMKATYGSDLTIADRLERLIEANNPKDER